MSLEAKIEALTVAVTQLTSALTTALPASGQLIPVNVAPQVAAATVPAAPAQNGFVPPAAAVPPAQPVAATMPPPPSFMAPAPAAPAPAGAPFTDSNGLIKYATDAYMAMGESKGPGLQNIITNLGHANINEIRPDQYAQFYALVEALKAQ